MVEKLSTEPLIKPLSLDELYANVLKDFRGRTGIGSLSVQTTIDLWKITSGKHLPEGEEQQPHS